MCAECDGWIRHRDELYEVIERLQNDIRRLHEENEGLKIKVRI